MTALPIALAALLSTAGAAAPAAPPAEPTPSLTMAEALAELDRRSPALAQARAHAEAASGLARQALAPLLPQLTATGAWIHNSDELKTPALPGNPAGILMQPGGQSSVTGALRVPLLSPAAWFESAAARAAARGAEAQADAARLGLRAALATTAHLGAAAEEVVEASTRSLESARELARSAERRVQAGTAAPLDALRAATEQVRREGDLVRARADLEKIRLALGTLLGRDAPVRVLVPEAAPAEPGPADPLVAQALAGRPELRALERQQESARGQLRAAWARLVPTLSVSGALFAADVPYPTGKQDGWRTTLELSWPLYDGGARYGRRAEAESRLAEAEAAGEAQRLQVSQEARDAARDLAVAAEQLRLAREQRRLAAEAAASAQRTYREGIASSLDVVDSSDRLYAADVGLAAARARLAAAGVALDRALGRGP